MWSFTIPGRFPSLNEYTEANRINPHTGAAMKRHCTARVRVACSGLGTPPGEPPWTVLVRWYERNAKRDDDNVAFGVKFILDGLVAAHVIPNDSRAYISGILHDVLVDRENPRIEVFLVERERVHVEIEEDGDGRG